MKRWTMLFALPLLASTALAQETARQVERPGTYTKYLTPGQLDTWALEADKGETLIAQVSTREFDPILELALVEKEDKVLLSVDDKGSESQFSLRLPKQGKYRIRIHGFKYQGGGNYALRIQRFQATPAAIGKPALGTFDREGRSYHYFQGEKDQILIPDIKGGSRSWNLLDSKGRPLTPWTGTVRIEKSGEHTLALSGQPGTRYQLVIAKARQQELKQDQNLQGQLEPGEMDVWSFQGEPGQFRVLEVEKQGELASRLLYAPLEKENGEEVSKVKKQPALRFLPVASKGRHLRFVALLGRQGRYQLHLLARTDASYTLNLRDATEAIEPGRDAKGSLPVGGSAFYGFRARPGQLLQASLVSEKFDSFLRLYDSRGNTLAVDDDGAGGLGSRITHMVQKEDLYRLQVSSRGDGGGGDFRLALSEQKLRELPVGGRGVGTLQGNNTDFWAFSGKEGKTVLLSVRSSVCDPKVSLYSPAGVHLGSDDNNGVGTDALLAVRLPETGRYTVWISSQRGAGNYTFRIIDGD